MSPFKKPLAETVCKNLRELILARRWRIMLPGIRALCEELQVSRQTMVTALRLLESEGYVMPARRGKPRVINVEIVNADQPVPAEGSHPVVAIIAWRRESHLSQTDEDVCAHLRNSFEALGYVHRHVVFHDISRARGQNRVDHVIEQNPADAYIVLGAHPQCSRKLKELGVAVVFLGGGQADGCYPRISYSFTDMCRTSLDHLVSIGHRRISVMLPEVLNNRAKSASVTEAALEPVFKSHKLPYSTFNCPRWGKTKEDFNLSLEKLFTLTPPTAMVLGDVHHVPRVVSFLMQRGLKYPADLSLVVLDDAIELQEYEPAISCMKKPNAKLAKIALNEVRKLLTVKSETVQELTIVPARLVVTGSIVAIDR